MQQGEAAVHSLSPTPFPEPSPRAPAFDNARDRPTSFALLQ